VRSERKKLLPEALLEFAEVGGLASEGGAVDLKEGREPLAIVASEVAVERQIGIDAEELAYHLDGEDLGVGELRSRTALSDASIFFSKPVVDETEDGNDEGVKIHERRPPSLRSVWAPPSVERSSPLFNRSRKLAHGVS
jgi:hypothetical protein